MLTISAVSHSNMDLEQALTGLMDAKRKLESKDAINIPSILSTQMDRLATYTSAVEEHLADLEKELEITEAQVWTESVKEGKSPSASDTIAKKETAQIRGEIKRLTRLTGSCWKLVSTKQSRWNHIQAELKGQV